MKEDYSFNQAIIDALKAGKTVWYDDYGRWIEVKSNDSYFEDLDKPVTKVKKSIERWATKDNLNKLEFCALGVDLSLCETKESTNKITINWDCVMAGMGRAGKVYPIELSNELLQMAVKNPVDLLVSNTEVTEE